MKEHEDRYAVVVEKHTLDGANANTLMNDKHIYVVPLAPSRML